MNKELFIVRHAHRDKTQGASIDNGISEKGIKQAKKLTEFILEEIKDFKKDKIGLFSSPKKRCLETLSFLSKKLDKEIEVLDLLNEGGMIEYKVEEFIKWWKEQKNYEVVIACSHGDIIPVLVYRLTGAQAIISKASVCEVELYNKDVFLKNLIQKP
jgi:broad specificity phosphatase PhoE